MQAGRLDSGARFNLGVVLVFGAALGLHLAFLLLNEPTLREWYGSAHWRARAPFADEAARFAWGGLALPLIAGLLISLGYCGLHASLARPRADPRFLALVLSMLFVTVVLLPLAMLCLPSQARRTGDALGWVALAYSLTLCLGTFVHAAVVLVRPSTRWDRAAAVAALGALGFTWYAIFGSVLLYYD